ncbi:hypothetical protein F8M41_015085 [Gigaspora margarita]|uniref:Uncharacterized protein n=1 Tax=Gigaspora margarita TaxID=4874 RepID=A0A8H4AR72_GIGMA|nr:hypothetical protein F8M41_015085 [Gigaspora margarita]
MYINIPKFLKIDKPIYNSYRESLRLIITAKYENNVPEFRKISENEKSEIIKRFKRKNPTFPLTACDWAIRRMMRGIINNKRDTEKRKTNSNLSYNSKKKNKDLSTETRESLEEFISSLGTSIINHDQPLEATRTTSPINNSRSTANTSTRSASRTPLTTLQRLNVDEVCNVSSNNTRLTTDIGTKSASHAPSTTLQQPNINKVQNISLSNTRLTTDIGTKSASRAPSTTLRQPNVNEIQDASSDYKKSQTSDRALRSKTHTRTQNNNPINEVTEAANLKKNAKKRSSKAPNKAKTKKK